MATLKRLSGGYLVCLAAVVAVYFVTNTVLGEAFDLDTAAVWTVLDVLMLIGLVVALAFNYATKRRETTADPGPAVGRRYLEANAVFYLTVGVTILFLHSWLALLALGTDSLDGNHQAWVLWAVVDVLLPIVLAVTGLRLWRESAAS